MQMRDARATNPNCTEEARPSRDQSAVIAVHLNATNDDHDGAAYCANDDGPSTSFSPRLLLWDGKSGPKPILFDLIEHRFRGEFTTSTAIRCRRCNGIFNGYSSYILKSLIILCRRQVHEDIIWNMWNEIDSFGSTLTFTTLLRSPLD